MIKILFTQGSTRKDLGKGHWKLLNMWKPWARKCFSHKKLEVGWVHGESPTKTSLFLYSALSFTLWRLLEIRNSVRWVIDPLWLLFCPETESLDIYNSIYGKRERGAKHLPSRETLKKLRFFSWQENAEGVFEYLKFCDCKLFIHQIPDF